MHLFDPVEIHTFVGNHINVYEKEFIEVTPLVFCSNTWRMIFIFIFVLTAQL